MADHTVTFDASGDPSPSSINIAVGDTVTFVAGSEDIVLCVDPEEVFGGTQYPIPAGQSIVLTVAAGAAGDFGFSSLVGNLEAECGARGTTGGDGSGKVGGQ